VSGARCSLPCTPSLHQRSSLRAVARSGEVWCRGRHRVPLFLIPVIALAHVGGVGAGAGAVVVDTSVVAVPASTLPIIVTGYTHDPPYGQVPVGMGMSSASAWCGCGWRWGCRFAIRRCGRALVVGVSSA
jgi:hypothetical protein